MSIAELEPGKFYWIQRGLCLEDPRTFDEQRNPEPARYVGKNQAGRDIWEILGFTEWFVSEVICECPVPTDFTGETVKHEQ